MKAATFGLVFGALSIANAQVFEEEDTLLQEEWEDFDADRELQFLDEPIEPSNPNTPGMVTEAEFEGLEEVGEEGEGEGKPKRRNKKRRDRRRNRRRNRKGRKGKKGKKGRKGKKKGPFNIEDYKARIAKRSERMAKKLKKKCAKRAKMAKKFCVERKNDNDNCGIWQNAMKLKCGLNGQCNTETQQKVAECTGDFKQMMASFKNDEINPDGRTHASVGQCFERTLRSAETCHKDVKHKYTSFLGEIEPPSEEELKSFREDMRAEKKAAREKRRQNRKNKRRNKNKNRKNKRRNRRNKNRRNNRRDRRNNNEDSESESPGSGSESGSGDE